MNRILWTFNVYDRLDDLRDNVSLVRAVLGDSVDICIVCNCPESRKQEFCDIGEDMFIWMENSGHHNGTCDAMNAVLRVVAQYDYIISSHADSFLIDPTIVTRIVDRMESEKKAAAFMDVGPNGCFGEEAGFGVPLDLFITTSRAYFRIFPVGYGSWAEVHVGKSLQENLGKDEVLWIPLSSFERKTGDMFYRGLMGEDCDVVSFHDRVLKIQEMRKISPAWNRMESKRQRGD